MAPGHLGQSRALALTESAQTAMENEVTLDAKTLHWEREAIEKLLLSDGALIADAIFLAENLLA